MKIEEIKKAFEKRGYNLKSTEYKNAKTKLEYICIKHPEETQSVTWDKFNGRGQGCKHCAMEVRKAKLKLPFEQVKAAFEERGYTLLETTYINNSTPMTYICPKHPDTVQTIGYNSLKGGHGCRFCGKASSIENKTFPYEQLKGEFAARGYQMITTKEEYKNLSSKINFVCPRHPDDVATVLAGTFKRGAGCNHCAYDAIRGENHPFWNPNLTNEDREANKSRHAIPKYMQWVRLVFEKDHFTCQKCGQVGGPLQAHHKDGWHWCEERRFDVSNGVTLCEDCHLDFHIKYGRKNNTEEQYEEWVK